MLHRPQPGQQPVELVVADGQRIAAREQHVAHLGVDFEIGQRLVPLAGGELVFAARIADDARARAIAAVGRAGSGGQEQHPVGITMDQPGNHRVVVLAERIVGLAWAADIFVAGHDVGTAQRFARIAKAHQAGVIGGNAHRQGAFVAFDRLALVRRQGEDPRQLVEGADAHAHLPTPIVPLHRGCSRVETAIESAGIGVYGETKRGAGSCRRYIRDLVRFLERRG